MPGARRFLARYVNKGPADVTAMAGFETPYPWTRFRWGWDPSVQTYAFGPDWGFWGPRAVNVFFLRPRCVFWDAGWNRLWGAKTFFCGALLPSCCLMGGWRGPPLPIGNLYTVAVECQAPSIPAFWACMLGLYALRSWPKDQIVFLRPARPFPLRVWPFLIAASP